MRNLLTISLFFLLGSIGACLLWGCGGEYMEPCPDSGSDGSIEPCKGGKWVYSYQKQSDTCNGVVSPSGDPLTLNFSTTTTTLPFGGCGNEVIQGILHFQGYEFTIGQKGVWTSLGYTGILRVETKMNPGSVNPVFCQTVYTVTANQ